MKSAEVRSLRMKGREIESAYTLSPMQQGMFFHSVYAEGSGLYVQQIVCRLREDLNVPLFERAWRRLVERHPVLRTCLRWADLAVPVQEVLRHVELPLTKSDWRGPSAQGPEERLEAYLAADRERGFVLTEAPLMRILLARVADAE
ncbi:MAG TPA: condensation domain-containing protein, partial [Pyrinomonadaceae bacterium]